MHRKIWLGVVAAVGAAGAVAFVFLIVVMVREGLPEAGAWAGPLGALASLVAAVAAAAVLVPKKREEPLSPESKVALPEPGIALPGVPEWVVDRPDELGAVVQALVRGTQAGWSELPRGFTARVGLARRCWLGWRAPIGGCGADSGDGCT